MKKLLSILLVVSMMFSLIPATLLTVAATEGSGVDTWSLTLKDDISVNFKMNIDESVAEDANAKVTATVGGDSYSWSASHAATNIINVPVCAAQMMDTITISIVSGNGSTVYADTYTAREYADYILANQYSATTKALVEAMLNYGGAAQTYFEYNTSNLANEGIAASALVPANDAKPVVVEDNHNGINFYGASLLMRNNIVIRYYFTIAEGAEAVFAYNGDVLTPVAKDNLYYVDVPVINPALYCEDFVITATSGDQVLSVTYSVERYIKRMYHKTTTSSGMQALAGSMYNYCKAAEAFQASSSVEVSYDLNGVIGATPATAILNSGENYGVLPVVDAGNELISFGGWYLDAACSADKAVTENTTVGTENHTLYAKWNVEGYKADEVGCDLTVAAFNGENAIKFTNTTGAMPKYWKDLKAGQTVKIKVSFDLPGFSGTAAEPQSWVFFYQMNANGANIGEHNTGIRACVANDAVKTGDGWTYSPENYAGPQTVTLELAIQQDCSGLVSLLHAPAGAEVYIHSIEVFDYDVSSANLTLENTTFNGESAVKFTSSNKPVSGNTRYWKNLKAGQTVQIKVSFDLPGFSGTTAEPQSWLFAYQMDANGNNIGEYSTGIRACLADGVVKTGDGWSYSPENYAGPQTVTLELPIQQDCSGLVMLLYAPVGTEVYIHSIDVLDYDVSNANLAMEKTTFNGESAVKFTSSNKPVSGYPRYWKNLKAGETVKVTVSFNLPGFSGTTAEPQSWLFLYQMDANGYNIGEYSTGIRACLVDGEVKTGDGWSYSPENYAGPQTVTLELPIQQPCSGLMMLMHAPEGAEVYIHSIDVISPDPVLENFVYTNSGYDFSAVELNGEKVVKITKNGAASSAMPKYWMNLKAGQTVQLKVSFDLPGFSGTTAEPQSWLFAYQMDANGSNIGEYNTGIRACLADGVVKTGDGWSYSPENYAGPQTTTLELIIQQDCSGLVFLTHAPEGTVIYIHSIKVAGFDVSNANLNMEKTTFNGESAMKFTSGAKPVSGNPLYWKDLKAGETVKIKVSFNLPGFSGTTAEPQSWLFAYQADANGCNISEYCAGIRACLVDGVVMTGDGWNYSPENYAGPQTVTLELKIQQDCSGLVMLLYAPEGAEVYIHSIEVIEVNPILENFAYNNSGYDFNVVDLNGEQVVQIISNGSATTTLPQYWKDLKAGQTARIKVTFDLPGFSGTTAEPQTWLFAYQMNADGVNVGDACAGARACLADGVVKTGDGWTYSPENYAGPQTVTLELPIQLDCSGIVFLTYAPQGTVIYIHGIEIV